MRYPTAIVVIVIALLAVMLVRLTRLADYDSMAKVVRLAEISGVSISINDRKIQCSVSDWSVLAATLNREGWKEAIVDGRDCQGRLISYSVLRDGEEGVAVETLPAGSIVLVQPEAMIYPNCE